MKQGEIWLINLDPTVGSEIQKTRPALIVNDDDLGVLPLKIIVPITDWKDKFINAPWMVKLSPDNKNNISKTSSLDCFQIRSVSEERFVKKIGIINNLVISEVKKSLQIVLDL